MSRLVVGLSTAFGQLLYFSDDNHPCVIPRGATVRPGQVSSIKFVRYILNCAYVVF